MNSSSTNNDSATLTTAPHPPATSPVFRPLRTWIPLLLLPLMIVARIIPGLVENGPAMIWMVSAFGPFLVGLSLIGWWLLVSRARWYERLLGIVGIVMLIAVEQLLAHYSMRGPLLIVMTIPMTIAGFTLGTVLFGKQLTLRRTWLALLLAGLGAFFSDFVKTDGVWGNFSFGFAWRWTPTVEDRLASKWKEEQSSPANPAAAEGLDEGVFIQPEWPGFRGPRGDGAQHGRVFQADWKTNPPQERWRIGVGPAWSSFAVAGHYLVTQEQRDTHETVVCYDALTGKQLWEHATESRFFESLGGLGPRATPTIAAGAVYALGAEGWLVKLQAVTGELIWRVDLRAVAERSPPMWGFSSSPCVHAGLVIVHAGGKEDRGVLAFRCEDGERVWSAAAGEHSYGSVQEVTVAGQTLLCLLSDQGAHFWEPDTGHTVLDYRWQHQGYRALQPQIVGDDRLLIPSGMGTGTRLVQLRKQAGEQLEAEELWTSKDLKPDFNDLVVYDGHVYGFDNAIFTCVSLADGKRKWKGGRYDKGQALLLADSGRIIVVSERGELVLLRANPDRLEELAKIPALDGKTWNHPVVVGNQLYIRNATEAVCYKLPE